MKGYYEQQVYEDVKNYILDNYKPDELKEKMQNIDAFFEELNDELWIDDDVTGNGSGEYTGDKWSYAADNVKCDIETVCIALREFCVDGETIAKHFIDGDWNYFDVRCYCLGSAICEALDDVKCDLEELKDEEEEEEDE